jgi:hypothetical protein
MDTAASSHGTSLPELNRHRTAALFAYRPTLFLPDRLHFSAVRTLLESEHRCKQCQWVYHLSFPLCRTELTGCLKQHNFVTGNYASSREEKGGAGPE